MRIAIHPSQVSPGRSPLRCQVECLGRGKERGFTLIELIISAALMTGILTVAYVCLQAGFSGRKTINTRGEIIQNARVALDRISADLRGAFPLADNYEFIGLSRMIEDVEADNMDFATHHYTPARPHEGDFCEVSYFLDRPEGAEFWSLWRRRDPTPDPEYFAGGSREEVAQGLTGLRFEYYDGFDWYDEWGETEAGDADLEEGSLLSSGYFYGMPDAVRVTLFFDSEGIHKKADSDKLKERDPPPPLVFQTIVHLNLAAISNETAYTSATSDSSTEDSGEINAEGGVPVQ